MDEFAASTRLRPDAEAGDGDADDVAGDDGMCS